MIEEDKSFIFNSFLKSYKQNSIMKFVPAVIYYREQTRIISYLLNSASTIVAVFPEAADEIMAYIIYEQLGEQLIVHYSYVKHLYRHNHWTYNTIKQLNTFDNNLIITSHIIDSFNKLQYKLNNYKVVYDPFYLINKIQATL